MTLSLWVINRGAAGEWADVTHMHSQSHCAITSEWESSGDVRAEWRWRLKSVNSSTVAFRLFRTIRREQQKKGPRDHAMSDEGSHSFNKTKGGRRKLLVFVFLFSPPSSATQTHLESRRFLLKPCDLGLKCLLAICSQQTSTDHRRYFLQNIMRGDESGSCEHF